MSPTKPWRRKCSGTSTTTGLPCDAWAIRGGTVCVKHGGKAPQTIAAAQRRLRARDAERELRAFGVEVPMEPTEGLLAMVRMAAGMVAALSGWVSESDTGLQEIHDFGGGSHHVEHVHFVMFREWCDRLVAYCAAAKRAGVDDQRIELEQAKIEILGRFVRDLLAAPELALPFEAQQVGLEVAGRLMRALPAA